MTFKVSSCPVDDFNACVASDAAATVVVVVVVVVVVFVVVVVTTAIVIGDADATMDDVNVMLTTARVGVDNYADVVDASNDVTRTT